MKTIILSIIGILIILHTFDQKQDKPTEDINSLIINSIKDLNPLKTYKTWTYVEAGEPTKQLQLLNNEINIPVYFQKCIEKIGGNVTILTPLNIEKYIPEFPIKMNKSSPLSLKKRTDILFAFILEKYGGICISPGTVVYDLTEPLRDIYINDIVTFGSSTPMNTGSVSQYYPDTYIIGSKPNSELIQNYKKQLLTTTYKNSSEILSDCLKEKEYKIKNYGPKTVGTHDMNNNKLSLSDYLNKTKINYLSKKDHLTITLPYNELVNNNEYKWFLNLSEDQFNNSELEIVRLLNN